MVYTHENSATNRGSVTLRCIVKLSLLSVVLVASANTAFAQVSVYLSPALTAFATGTGSNLTFKNETAGFIAGGFYNFPIQSRVTVGLDLRTVLSPGTMGGDFTGAALRIAFVPQRVILRPYLQIGGGVVTTTVKNYVLYTGNTFTIVPSQRFTNGAAEFDFGLDIRLTEHFDLRAIDYGAAAGGSSTTNVGMGFLGAGVVYHLQPR